MDQRTREERLFLFRSKKVNYLIVTDLAARGLDIPLLANVIHFDFPPKMKLFIHRSGRTARAG
jgi:ATP-dependent RNA helicase DDX54/DBP10